MGAIKIDAMGASGLAEVSEFYDTVGYGGGVSPSDVIIVARSAGRMLGAVRLCTEGGVMVLRGMHVTPALHGKGIGRVLLDHCVPYLDRGPAYCVPYEHLVKFYGQVGFVVALPASLPAFLAERLAGYTAANRRTLAMRRVPP